ncbi:hypothetical protein K474DRAFT_1663970 [Panus rudis PR-1116 ss-1]|nr:hypothetical protein K474DRAFT_1663970 [Panus rudis PR-1116 ss-1]
MRSTTDASPPPSVMPLKYRRKSLSDDDRGEVAPQLSTRQSAATPFTYSSSSCSSSPIATSAVLTNSSSGSPTGFAHTRDGDSPDDPYRDFAHLPRSSQSARFNSSRSKAVDAWLHDKDAVRYTGGQPGVYAYRATPSHYSYYNPVPSSPSDFDPTYSDAIDSYVQTSTCCFLPSFWLSHLVWFPLSWLWIS